MPGGLASRTSRRRGSGTLKERQRLGNERGAGRWSGRIERITERPSGPPVSARRFTFADARNSNPALVTLVAECEEEDRAPADMGMADYARMLEEMDEE